MTVTEESKKRSVPCDYCGKMLIKTAYHFRNYKHSFCDNICSTEHKKMTPEEHAIKRLIYTSQPKNKLRAVWRSMMFRCYSEKADSFSSYGARGICVSDEWHDFSVFYADMKDGYANGLTIERNDNNGNYCKGNCRWATIFEQAQNKSTNRRYEYNGRNETLSEWARILGVNRLTLYNRINVYGWSIEESFTTPITQKYHHVSNN